MVQDTPLEGVRGRPEGPAVRRTPGADVVAGTGRHSPQGFGEGEDVIYNTSYQQVAHVRAGNGLFADLHEFALNPDGTAITTAFDPVHCNLSSIGGPADAAVTDGVFQEIDVRTGLVRREWHALDHVPLADSYPKVEVGHARTLFPYDFFHINSVDSEPDGVTMVSAQHVDDLQHRHPYRPGPRPDRGQAEHREYGPRDEHRLAARRPDPQQRRDHRVRQRRGTEDPPVLARDRGVPGPEHRHDDPRRTVRALHTVVGGHPGKRADPPQRGRHARMGRAALPVGVLPERPADLRRPPRDRRPVIPRVPLRMVRPARVPAGRVTREREGVRELERRDGGRELAAAHGRRPAGALPVEHRRTERVRDRARPHGLAAVVRGAGAGGRRLGARIDGACAHGLTRHGAVHRPEVGDRTSVAPHAREATTTPPARTTDPTVALSLECSPSRTRARADSLIRTSAAAPPRSRIVVPPRSTRDARRAPESADERACGPDLMKLSITHTPTRAGQLTSTPVSSAPAAGAA